jgi:hypothetical protein
VKPGPRHGEECDKCRIGKLFAAGPHEGNRRALSKCPRERARAERHHSAQREGLTLTRGSPVLVRQSSERGCRGGCAAGRGNCKDGLGVRA